MYKIGKLFCAVLIAFIMFAAPAFSSDSAKVDINKANAEELATLKGIGPAIAEKVIEYRKQNGDFKTVEDFKEVSGIGDKILEDNKDLIVIKAPPVEIKEEKTKDKTSE